MKDENMWEPTPKPIKPSEPQPKNKDPGNDIGANGNMAVIGYNLLVLIAYTVLCATVKDLGPFLDAILLTIHVLVCIITSIASAKWNWALSALVVLLIGVSTCVGILWKLN